MRSHGRPGDALLLAAALGLVIPGASSSETIAVAADGSFDHATIGEAMAAAVDGDTVRVGPGTYRERVVLRSGVVVHGSGYEDTRIEVDWLANPVYAPSVAGAEISDFTLAYTGSEPPVVVLLQSARVTVSRCRITSTGGIGVYAVDGSEVEVRECVVEQNDGFGVYVSSGSRGYVRDSQIRGNDYAGVAFDRGASGEVTGCLLTENSGNGITVNGAGPVVVSGSVLARNSGVGVFGLEGADMELRRNTVVGNGSYGILLRSGSVASIYDNVVVGNLYGGIVTTGGEQGDGSVRAIGHNGVWGNGLTSQSSGNRSNYQGAEASASDLTSNPCFFDEASGDYRLRSNSPLIGAASDGGTIGALGVAGPEEERASPSTVSILAFPKTAYWTLTQDQAFLSVDLHMWAGTESAFVPEEVEMRFFGHDDQLAALERIPSADFRTTAARIEGNVVDLLMVWDASQTELKPPPSLEVPPGGRGVFLPREIPFARAELPVRAEYVVRGREGDRSVERVCEVVPTFYQQRTDFRLPLRGGGWMVLNGPPEDNHRHRGMGFRGDEASVSGRYALDIVRCYGGRLHRSDGSTNTDYWDYGAPVYAPAAGQVIEVKNDGTEGDPGGGLGTGANFVVIDHQNGEQSSMFHFIPGSVVVEEGQWVEQGDLVAALGASGRAWDLPHLHFQVDDGQGWPSEGFPVTFRGGRILGVEIQDGMLLTGSLFEGESLGPVLRVAADGSGQYLTIGDAMVAAVAGDTVRVGPGIYRERVVLKSGVVVQGSGYEHTRIEVDWLANPVWASKVAEAEIVGFTLAYTGSELPVVVLLQSAQATISQCRITSSGGIGVYAVEGSEVVVRDCLVEQNKGFGVSVRSDSKGYVRDSRIRGNEWAGVSFDEEASGEVTGCFLTANNGHGITVNGAGPIFVSGNVLAGNSGAGLFGMAGADLEIRRNTLVANGTLRYPAAVGQCGLDSRQCGGRQRLVGDQDRGRRGRRWDRHPDRVQRLLGERGRRLPGGGGPGLRPGGGSALPGPGRGRLSPAGGFAVAQRGEWWRGYRGAGIDG